ncbi:MAG: GNAT family N-acetyltransferase [Oscillospiraceae bacterium]|jgi:GNAT superfamily N-acetyltransferase|nr:GNAT family N-acetyltransferase [Oscillospiraceae bacterium]
MSVTYTNAISPEEYNALRSAVGWSARPIEQARQALNGSAFTVTACCADRAVGIARALCDGGDSALIKDVMVLPDYQRQGIGLELMSRIMEFLHGQLNPGWDMQIELASTRGKEQFYQKFGFELRPTDRYGNGMVMRINQSE